jgi:hypothetical protein
MEEFLWMIRSNNNSAINVTTPAALNVESEYSGFAIFTMPDTWKSEKSIFFYPSSFTNSPSRRKIKEVQSFCV